MKKMISITLLMAANNLIFSSIHKNKEVPFYSSLEDKKWALKKQFFIGKKDKDSSLWNIPRNMINYIFKFVVPEPRCYVKSLSPFNNGMGAYHHRYEIGFDVLISKSVMDNMVNILQKTATKKNATIKYQGIRNPYRKNHYCPMTTTIFVYSMAPRKFQEHLDDANKVIGSRSRVKKINDQSVFSCAYN